jgi:hypothetical protein
MLPLANVDHQSIQTQGRHPRPRSMIGLANTISKEHLLSGRPFEGEQDVETLLTLSCQDNIGCKFALHLPTVRNC